MKLSERLACQRIRLQLESLGVVNTVSQLRQQAKKQQQQQPRTYQKKLYGLTPLRYSQRISNNLTPPPSQSQHSTPIKQGLSFFLYSSCLSFLEQPPKYHTHLSPLKGLVFCITTSILQMQGRIICTFGRLIQ